MILFSLRQTGSASVGIVKLTLVHDIRAIIGCLTLVTMLYSPISWFLVCLAFLLTLSALYYILLGIDQSPPAAGSGARPPDAQHRTENP